jgi:hypothetical protein
MKDPATKGPGYKRSGDERSGVLKVQPQNSRQEHFDTKRPKYVIFVNISKQFKKYKILYGKEVHKNAIDLT